MKGRKPKPDSKVVQFKSENGLSPDERHRQESEKLAPDDLSQSERMVWDRVAPELSKLGRLKAQFVDVIAEYCRVVVRMIKLRGLLVEKGETYAVVGRNGCQEKSRPEIAQFNEAWRQWRSLTAMLGLSPADERGLVIGQGDLFGNPFADLERKA